MKLKYCFTFVLGFGCALGLSACPEPLAPTDYGRELRACEDQSNTTAEYTACCTRVAGKYGRDSYFCDLDLDGGTNDR